VSKPQTISADSLVGGTLPGGKPVTTETIIPVGYRTGEVAAMFGVDPRTVNNWVRTGVLPGRLVGRTLLIWRGPVDRLLAEAEAA
jgi:hypothetical protein